MSRLARKPVPMPQGVSIEKKEKNIHVKGPKGELDIPYLPHVLFEMKPSEEGEGTVIWVKKEEGIEGSDENVGTLWSLLRNAIHGVMEGFTKVLEVEGVGYRVEMKGKDLVLSLGFTNPITFSPPQEISITVEKNAITVSGVDKAQVGKVASEIRAFRPPEPYKGKGVRYRGEVIRRKVGKKAGAAAE